MSTGLVKTIHVAPTRKEDGEVIVSSPMSREPLFTGTPAAAATFLATTYPGKFNEASALEFVNEARETRGRSVGVGYVQQYDTVKI